MELTLIKQNAPEGAQFFAPAPKWVGGAFYFKTIGSRVLMLDIQNKWVQACETIEELFERGGLPLTYEPIDWLKKLEMN